MKKVNKIFNKGKFKDTIVLCPPFVYMPFFKVKNKNVFSEMLEEAYNMQLLGDDKETILRSLKNTYEQG